MKGLSVRASLLLVFFCGVAVLVVPSCRRESTQESQGLIAADATPEEVIRLYQSFLDNNQFDQLKMLSTEKEQARLEEVRRIVMEENQDSTRLNSVFLAVSCQVEQESASCKCRIRDEYETYSTSFYLVRRGKRWLVDVPEEEEIRFDEEEVKNAVDSFFEPSKK